MKQSGKPYIATIIDFGSRKDLQEQRALKMLAFPELRGAIEVYPNEAGAPDTDAVLLVLWMFTESEEIAASAKEALAGRMERNFGDRSRAVRLDQWPADVSWWPTLPAADVISQKPVYVRPDCLESFDAPSPVTGVH